ncbi:MAG TPA: SpoIIE family protein phosphatase [Acidobacteriaceae bacterium]|nr:SpoIIE family protein phosphatase [Acidobacteriaceae bacterium]
MPSISSENYPSAHVELVDLQQQVARLQALLETSRQVHSTVQLDELLNTVLRIVVRELELPGALVTEPRMTYGAMPPEPWDGCPRFPLQTKDGYLLAELIVAPPVDRTLSIYEQDFLEGLALQAGVALENARYHERNLEWTRVQRDLEAARLIQRSLLPQQMPEIAGYSIAFRSTACYEVGGDYVDIVELPGGAQIMTVADVAGKGLASAIVGTAFRSAFRAIATAGVPLVELASRLNDQHYAEGAEARRRYVTAIFLRLEPATHMLEVVNAGHNPGFLLRDGRAQQIVASGTPIGLVPGMQYSAEQFAFPAGSRLLFYTDGLTEVFQGDDEFGTERLLQSFQGCDLGEGAAILDSLWRELHDFCGGAHQEDDMTALALLREPG